MNQKTHTKAFLCSCLCVYTAITISCGGREISTYDPDDAGADLSVSTPDSNSDSDGSRVCDLGGVFYGLTYQEYTSIIDVDFTAEGPIEDIVYPSFARPALERGRAELVPRGLSLLTGLEGLSAKIESQLYAAVITGNSMEATFDVSSAPAFTHMKSIRIELLGGSSDSEVRLVSSGLDWTGDEVKLIIESFTGIEPPTSTSIVVPFENYGETVSLRAYTEEDIAVVDLVRANEVLATVKHEDSVESLFGGWVQASSTEPENGPAFTLHSLRSDDVFLYTPDVWSLDVPTLTFNGEKYATLPDYGAALRLRGDIRSTRAFNDPELWPLLFPFAGGTEPLRYYLVDITDQDGMDARATFYALSELAVVEEWLGNLFPAPARATVKTHGIAFEHDGSAYVPVFSPSICP